MLTSLFRPCDKCSKSSQVRLNRLGDLEDGRGNGKRETVVWQGDISCFRCFRQLESVRNDVRMTSLKRDLGECWYYRSKFGVVFFVGRSRECELPIFLRMRVLVGQVELTKSYASSWVF